jgi:hypothetical protein
VQPTRAAEPTRNVGPRWVAFIALANLGLYLGYFGPLEVLLPNQVQAIVPDGRRAGRDQLGAGLEDPLGSLSQEAFSAQALG